MIIDNKLDKSFGLTGVSAGYLLIIVGIFTIASLMGAFLIILGAFMALSHSGTSINMEKGEILFYNKLLGLFKIGNSIDLNKFDALTISHTKRSSRTFSRGNRVLNIDEFDYRIFLTGPRSKKRIPVKKFKTKEEAKIEAIKLSGILDIPFVEKK